ncbi:uncharacterized protein ZBAI_01212 [Zygosaccharomyces bailii ISA1307]|nr:uncharacterized protein ZBAI_01212 [Zygosaccharomyces bailii ISA1307]
MFNVLCTSVSRGSPREEDLSGFLTFSFHRRALGHFSNFDLAKSRRKKKKGRKLVLNVHLLSRSSGPFALGAPWYTTKVRNRLRVLLVNSPLPGKTGVQAGTQAEVRVGIETGISGSQARIQAGVKQGYSREVAAQAAAQVGISRDQVDK